MPPAVTRFTQLNVPPTDTPRVGGGCADCKAHTGPVAGSERVTWAQRDPIPATHPVPRPPTPTPRPPVLPPSLFFLAGFSLHPGRSVPPPGLPGADKSPTEAPWLRARVSAAGRSQGCLRADTKGGIEGGLHGDAPRPAPNAGFVSPGRPSRAGTRLLLLGRLFNLKIIECGKCWGWKLFIRFLFCFSRRCLQSGRHPPLRHGEAAALRALHEAGGGLLSSGRALGC